MKIWVIVISLLIWLTPEIVLAAPSSTGLSSKQITRQEIENAKCSLETIDRLLSTEIISEKEANRIKTNYASQFNLTNTELDQLIVEQRDSLSLTKRLAGLFSFANLIAIFSSFLLAVAFGALAILYLIPLLKLIPLGVYETILYLICLGAIAVGCWLDSVDLSRYVMLSGCLGTIGALSFSYSQHRAFWQQLCRKIGLDAFSLGALSLFILWSGVAIFSQNIAVAFLAIIALEAFWGFAVAVMPLTYFIGFRNRDVVPRTMLVSLLLLVIYIAAHITNNTLPYFEVFAPAVKYVASFVYFIGLLIVSSKWYFHKQTQIYWLMQGIAVISGLAALYTSYLWQIKELSGIGGTILVLYAIEKYIELPWSPKTIAWASLGLSLMLYACAWLIRNYPQYFLIG